METADSIFHSHLQDKQRRRLTHIRELKRLQRTITAANAAIESAEREGDADAARRYTAIMANTQAELEKTQTALEKARTPISIDEGAAAWEEKGASLKNDLLNRISAYEEDREALADILRQILEDYLNYREAWQFYMAACRDKTIPADQLRKQLRQRFPVFRLDADSIRADLEFYRQTADILPEDVDCYLECLQEVKDWEAEYLRGEHEE